MQCSVPDISRTLLRILLILAACDLSRCERSDPGWLAAGCTLHSQQVRS